jgi:hypothetical protein
MTENVTLQDIYYKLGQMEAALTAHLKQEDEQTKTNAELHHKIEVLQLKMSWFVGASAMLGAGVTLVMHRLFGGIH